MLVRAAHAAPQHHHYNHLTAPPVTTDAHSPSPPLIHLPTSPLPPPPLSPRHHTILSPRLAILARHPYDASTPSLAAVRETTRALTACLSADPRLQWCITGGACLIELGSARQTRCVDVALAPGTHAAATASALVRADARFALSDGGDPTGAPALYTADGHVVGVRFVQYPLRRAVSHVAGVPCESLAALLDGKCAAVLRVGERPHRDDIVFLLQLAISRGVVLAPRDVPRADALFLDWFEKRARGSKLMFRRVGLWSP